MGTMTNTPDEPMLSVECETCIAAGTTACTDCLVTHLLANDDGPVPVTVVTPAERERAEIDRAVGFFVAAGLVDEPVVFVDVADFERGVSVPARTVGA